MRFPVPPLNATSGHSISLGDPRVTEGRVGVSVTAYSPRASYSFAVAALSATTWGTAMYAPEAAKALAPVPHLTPHPLHDLHPHDAGAAAVVGFSVAALYATARAVRWKNMIRLHPSGDHTPLGSSEARPK